MSELRRNGGANDADTPVVNDKSADKSAGRPQLEIRTADMDPERPVNRPLVTKAQRYYSDLVKQAGDVPPVGDTDVVYVKDWATGESLDHKYPHIAGGKDRPESDDPPDEAMPGFARLDGRAFQAADDGWGEVVAPADATPETDDRPGDELSTPAGVPSDVGTDRARSASMSISERRDRIAKSDAGPLPDFHRDNSGLDASTVGRTDESWYDRLDGPQTEETDSRARSLVKKAAKSTDKILEIVGNNTDISRDISGRPPTQPAVGHAPPSSPDMPGPLHGAHTPGDVATAIASAMLTVGAVGSMVYHKYENRKDRHGGNG